MPSSSSSSSVVPRVPEPGSRRSRTWRDSSSSVDLPHRRSSPAGRGHQHQDVGPGGQGDEAAAARRPAADGQVDLALGQQLPQPLPVADLQGDLGVGVAGPEGGQEAGQDVLAGGGDRGQADPARSRGRAPPGGGRLPSSAMRSTPAGVAGEHHAGRR